MPYNIHNPSKEHPAMWDKAKAIESVVYLANRVHDPTRIKIFKLMYFADKLHMSRYGRFIVGDLYVAMKNGPVPSRTYDLVKEIERGQESDAIVVPNSWAIKAKRDARMIEFSETDIECFEEIIGQYGRDSAKQLSKISHGDAWDRVTNKGQMFEANNNGPQSTPMPLDYIVDELPNSAAVRRLLQIEGDLPTPP